MVNSRVLISTAFAIMLVLMVTLIAAGLGRLSVINANLQEIVVQYDVKSALVLEMRNAARERAMILHRLVLTADPFERDEML